MSMFTDLRTDVAGRVTPVMDAAAITARLLNRCRRVARRGGETLSVPLSSVPSAEGVRDAVLANFTGDGVTVVENSNRDKLTFSWPAP